MSDYQIQINIVCRNGRRKYKSFPTQYPLPMEVPLFLSLLARVEWLMGRKFEALLFKWEYVPDGECVSQDLILQEKLI